jgi:hypothetical protein
MQNRRMTHLLLTPSMVSAALCFVIGIVALSLADWTFFFKELSKHQYLTGRQNLGDYSVAGHRLGALIPIDAATLLGGVFCLLFVVLFFQTLAAIRRQTVEGPGDGFRRFGARLLVLAAWLTYIFVTAKIILPFCALAVRLGGDLLLAWQGFAYLLFGIALFVGALHVHIIFLRLFMLRPRVFGNDDALLLEEFEAPRKEE